MALIASEMVTAPAGALPQARGVARLRAYLDLTRPRVLLLVLFSASPVLLAAPGGKVAASVFVGVIAGCALLGAGSSALNAWYERERDARMERTRDRPLPTGRLAPGEALGFGLAVSALALAVLYAAGGGLAAGLGAATLGHYLGVYTVWLKPRTPWNVVVGGMAGAAAPLIADAAVDGHLGRWGLLVFALVFLWQPPHVWAIALYRRHEYEAAGFPMLPSVIGACRARRWMAGFAGVLVAVSLLPVGFGALGALYGGAALGAGAYFLGRIRTATRQRSLAGDRAVFVASVIYLSGLLAAMSVELLVR